MTQPFQFSFHQLSPREGLSQGSNDFVYQDSRGFIWLSSLDGVNRFDGKDVKIYKAGAATGLYDNIINSNFFEDEEANLWFATYERLHCYLRAEDRFVAYALLDEQQDTIRQDYHAFHLDAAHNLWIRTGIGENGRLHHFNVKALTDRIICPLSGYRIMPMLGEGDKPQALLSSNFSTGAAGIRIREMTPPYSSNEYFTGQDSFPATRCRMTLADGEDLVWLAGDDALIAFFPGTGKYKRYDQFSGKPIGSVGAIGHLREHYLLVATAQAGVLIFDKTKRLFLQKLPDRSADQYGITENAVTAFYVDPQDNLWASSAREGLSYAHLDKRKFGSVESLRGTAVISVYQASDGTVWCNGEAGKVLAFAKGGEIPKTYDVIGKGIRPRKVSFFFEDERDNLWACHGRNLFRWDAKLEQFSYTQSLPASVLFVSPLRGGNILVSTYRGIYTLQLVQEDFAITPDTTLGEYSNQLATAIFEDQQGRIFLALDANKLVILENDGQGFGKIKQIDRIGYVKSFHDQGTNCWVATTSGLLSLNQETLAHKHLNKAEDGLPQEGYYCALPDDDGKLWLSGNQGIIRYDLDKTTYYRYTLADGLQGIEYNTNAFLKSSDGRIWLGGNQGMNVFTPPAIKKLTTVPQVQWTNLLINDEPHGGNIQESELTELNLPYADNTISILARALEYSDPEHNRFEYRLTNYEEAWVDGGTNGFIRYPNLSPGQYMLQVRATNSDGVWSKAPKSLAILIQTPWWQSWWFYLACMLVISLIIYAVFNYRLQQALKLERMRVKISADLHDDVGSILTGLAMQAEVVELTAKAENKPRLTKISELSRSALSRMRDTVWAIDARKDKLEHLLFRIQEHAEETLSPKGLRFKLQTPPELDLEKNLPGNIRQNFYLIAKEAITNAAKHTTGNCVTVQVEPFQQGISLEIHDNGVVKDKNYQTTGLGLSNMEMRAQQINASFALDKTDGFRIKVALPRFR